MTKSLCIPRGLFAEAENGIRLKIHVNSKASTQKHQKLSQISFLIFFSQAQQLFTAAEIKKYDIASRSSLSALHIHTHLNKTPWDYLINLFLLLLLLFRILPEKQTNLPIFRENFFGCIFYVVCCLENVSFLHKSAVMSRYIAFCSAKQFISCSRKEFQFMCHGDVLQLIVLKLIKK